MTVTFRTGSPVILTAPVDPAVEAAQTWRMTPPPPPKWLGIWMWNNGDDHAEDEFDTYDEAVAWARQRSDYIRVVGDGGPDGVRTL